MRILHLLADWKWTGPAEPLVDLCVELRALGHDPRLICAPPPEGAATSLVVRARERGFEAVPLLKAPEKGWIASWRNIGSVREYIDREEIDLVHVHQTRDHLIGGAAARRSRRRPPVVRTHHRGVPFPGGPGARWLMGRLTDAYLTYSTAGLEADRRRYPALLARRIDPALRLDRYRPEGPHREMRPRFGFAPGDFVAGVVARVQKKRRFDILLEAVRLAAPRLPHLRVLVVGRGTRREEVAVEPARRMGLLDRHLFFSGYLADDYLDTLAMFDAQIFLVPGSDGTCRALREGMAMGKPILAARRGMIPEIVDHERTGLVIDDTPENLAAAIERMAGDTEARRRWGRAGREKAVQQYDIRRRAPEISAFYAEVLSSGGRTRRNDA